MWLLRRAADRENARKEHEHFVAPLKELLAELFADRGMLLGSSQYLEMLGVEKHKALSEIDDRIIEVKNRIQSEGLLWKKRQ
tara:strand:- start:9315 stop:9560 length:246 start_codon:yes stop_codon:yes gene_type:complete